jgi:hypothetical protein
MLFLSINGWINDTIVVINFLSIIILFTFGTSFGLWIFIKSRKPKIKLLSIAGLMILCTALQYITPMIDIFTIIITGHNMDNSFGLHGKIFYIWAPIMTVSALYISSELLIPKKKWYLIFPFIFLSIIYIFLLFFDYDNSISVLYPTLGEYLIHSGMNFGSPFSLILAIFIFTVLIFNGLGLLIKYIQTKAEIRKKYLLLSLAFIVYTIDAIIDTTRMIVYELEFILKLFVIVTFLLLYYGLKPAKPSKPKKKIPSEEERKFASYIMGKPKAINYSEEITASDVVLKEKLLLFMSYATKDVDTFKVHDIAKKLTEFPEIENVLYWEEHMEDNIFEYMDENLDKCDAMILFCSENARDSVPVKKEWTAAEPLGKPIIPVFYNPHHIPALLSSRLGVQFDFYDMERNVQDLRNLILKKIGGLTE